MLCEVCGAPTEIKKGQTYHYKESGLDNIYLEDIEVRVCTSEECKTATPRIPRILELHRVIGQAVALKDSPLSGAEARFLRKHLGYQGREWAKLLHVDESTLSKWETQNREIGPQSDALIR